MIPGGTGRMLSATGAAVTAAALAWWGLSFGPVYLHDFIGPREALACSVVDGEICRLASSLCSAQHAWGVAGYRSASLWIGLALLGAGGATWMPTPRRKTAR